MSLPDDPTAGPEQGRSPVSEDLHSSYVSDSDYSDAITSELDDRQDGPPRPNLHENWQDQMPVPFLNFLEGMYAAIGVAAYPSLFAVQWIDDVAGLGLTPMSGPIAVVLVAGSLALSPLVVVAWRMRGEYGDGTSHSVPSESARELQRLCRAGGLRFVGTERFLERLGPIEDAPVVPRVFPVTLSVAWPPWIIALLCVLGPAIGVVLRHTIAFLAGTEDPDAAMPLQIHFHAGIGIAAVLVAVVRPVRLRLSSGQLETIRYGGYFARKLRIKSFDLTECKLLVTPIGFRVYPPGTAKSLAVGPIYTGRLELLATLLRAAVSTQAPPHLPDDELLG